MAKEERTHAGAAVPRDTHDFAPRAITKDEFGRRVYSLMLSKGWNQSELARRASLNRDAISTYVRGASLPSDGNLRKLAAALEVKPEDLLPNVIGRAFEKDNAELELKVSPGRPDYAWVKINRLLSLEAALKVMEIVRQDDEKIRDEPAANAG
ncbi:helix-turn-helix domain-containing protein [Polycladidibacter hongkongensis]|uniref:helix-turn-helix domain-containing protein n=1 Tax=Polycladidibacter hongkongensis TaxID=1647556 RepID=UPI0008336084|nr:helix-turn-helix transcriptional regulator [Pseudovibrio hongkongensis]